MISNYFQALKFPSSLLISLIWNYKRIQWFLGLMVPWSVRVNGGQCKSGGPGVPDGPFSLLFSHSPDLRMSLWGPVRHNFEI